MMYKPAELASEIDVTIDTIYRSYLPAGLPHTRDKKQIWIYGPAFVAWAKETVVKRHNRRRGIPEDHAWCMKCGTAVIMNNPKTKYSNRVIEIVQSRCPNCGSLVNRAYARLRSPQTSSPLGEVGRGKS
jgi:ribosomal protein S27AE